MSLKNCNTKDKIDTINFGKFWRCFMIDIIDIMVWNERGDETAQEPFDFVKIDCICENKKLDLNVMDYPCTPQESKIRKLMKN